MERISERVSVEYQPDGLSVVITARLPRAKESLLVAWFLAWTFCGAYFAWLMFTSPYPDTQRGSAIMLAFWAFFEWRIGRVLLWRVRGFEIWRLKDDRFTIKDSLFGYGRASDYFIENIQRFGLLMIDENSWKWQLNDSFWVKGAERLGFENLGKKVVFGKGLTREEASRLAVVLESAFKKARKKIPQ
jgi:hypothetical protein